MTIPYSALPDIRSKVVLAPLVPVTFFYREQSFSTFALVDSGASGAVISTVIADALGIAWDTLPASGGFSVGGTFRSRPFDQLTAEVLDHTFPLAVNIIEGIAPYKCILGQADLFQRAKITFEAYKKQFSIVFRNYN
jgi:hypothetical protein